MNCGYDSGQANVLCELKHGHSGAHSAHTKLGVFTWQTLGAKKYR